jgi:hypothetical protein
VTVTLERPGSLPGAGTTGPRRRLLLAIQPWLLPVVALGVAWHFSGTPGPDIVLYALYFAAAIVLPGTLTFRALLGSRGNLPEDLGLGGTTGLLLMLIGWAVCAVSRLPALLPLWPLLVIALFVAVPRLRRHWHIPAGERRPLPVAWSWVIAATLCLIVLTNFRWWIMTPLPPATTAYYQDLMYHLALVREMTRSIPFQVPQAAGETLRYHYLSDADMAIASMVTKIPAPVVLLRLWIVPICGLSAFVLAALGRQITGKWWAGALGGAAAAITLPLVLGSPVGAFGQVVFNVDSPSEVFSIPLVGLLVVIAVDVLSGRQLGWAWVMIFPLALACAGAKSSSLPPFVAGLFLAALVVAWRYRDRLRGAVVLFGLTLAAMLVGARLFAGAGSGTLALQPFAILEWVAPYRTTIGAQDTIDGTRVLPLGVEQAGTGGTFFVAGLVFWWFLLQSPRVLGVLALAERRPREEPAVWLLAGMTVAGSGAFWLFWHPSASQVYFFLGVAPFAVVLTVWLLAYRARSWRPVVAGLAAGAVWGILAPQVHRPGHDTMTAWVWVLAKPLLWSAIAAFVVAAATLVAWRLATGRFAWRALSAGVIAAVLGAAFVPGPQRVADQAFRHLFPSAKAAPIRPGQAGHLTAAPTRTPAINPDVTAEEMRAALWLDKHAGLDDVIATNVHCRRVPPAGVCDARAFWVSALTGRRALIESWGYTDGAFAMDGAGGLRYYLQPAPDQRRYILNQRVFTHPDRADVATMRDVYHVRWLFADRREPGGVAPDLGTVARLVFTAGPASIYQL